LNKLKTFNTYNLQMFQSSMWILFIVIKCWDQIHHQTTDKLENRSQFIIFPLRVNVIKKIRKRHRVKSEECNVLSRKIYMNVIL